MKERQLYEKVINKGAHNGDTIVADPVAKTATLPNSKNNAEPMNKIQDPNHPGIEDTDSATNTKPAADKSASNKASVAMKEETEETNDEGESLDLSDISINVAFEGEELSEEFKQKATTIFEAAVSAKVDVIHAQLEEQYSVQVQEAVEQFTVQITEQLDKYLDYIVEQWMQENEIAIQDNLRTDIAEEFMEGLKSLFAEHYIEVPEDKLDVLDELSQRVQELEQKLDEAMTDNVELSKTMKGYAKESILARVAEGLTVAQKDKFTTLAEGVDFTDEETYEKKLEIVKENYFKTPKSVSTITESEVELAEDTQPDVKPRYEHSVARYMQAISRTAAKK